MVMVWGLVALIGVLAGALSYVAVPGPRHGKLIPTMLVGAGAVAMTWLGARLGAAVPGQTSGFFVTVIGSGFILALWRVLMSRA